MLIILFLSTQDVPKLRIRNADKVLHFMVYGTLCVLVFWPLSRDGARKRPYLLSILAAVTVGILDEAIQHFNTSRVASMGDLLSDMAGACSAGIISRLMHGPGKKSADS